MKTRLINILILLAFFAWVSGCEDHDIDGAARPDRSTGMVPGTERYTVKGNPGDILKPSEWMKEAAAWAK